MPKGPRWPLTWEPVSQRRALDLLCEIIVEAGRKEAANFDLLVHLAAHCAANDHGRVIDDDLEHAEIVRRARDLAANGQWALAARFLEH
jgi:hypothetical protein